MQSSINVAMVTVQVYLGGNCIVHFKGARLLIDIYSRAFWISSCKISFVAMDYQSKKPSTPKLFFKYTFLLE